MRTGKELLLRLLQGCRLNCLHLTAFPGKFHHVAGDDQFRDGKQQQPVVERSAVTLISATDLPFTDSPTLLYKSARAAAVLGAVMGMMSSRNRKP